MPLTPTQLGVRARWHMLGVRAAARAANKRPLLRATFTAPDGTGLAGLVNDIGPTWAMPNGGSWATSSNRAIGGASAANNKYAVADVGVADVALAATITTGAAGYGPGLLLRAAGVSANGYWVVVFSLGQAVLYEYNGTTFTQRATGGTVAAATAYRLVVTASGATITAYVGGVQVLTYASATRNQGATQHGLHEGVTGTAQSAFDDCVIWRAGAVPVPGGVV